MMTDDDADGLPKTGDLVKWAEYGGVVATVLATDAPGGDNRPSAWIRFLPKGSEFYRYRSCELIDLERAAS